MVPDKLVFECKVFTDQEEEEELLTFEIYLPDDIVKIYLGGQKIASCDWSGNLMIVLGDILEDVQKITKDL